MIKRKNLQVSLKTKYPMVLKESLIITLLVFITAFYFKPEIVHRNLNLDNIVKAGSTEIVNTTITQFDMPQVKKPVTPVIPIEAAGEDGLTDTDHLFEGLQKPHIFDPTDAPVFEKAEMPTVDIPFWDLTTKPEPIGGFAAIQRNVIYPEIALEAGVEGTVFVSAHLDENGNVTECKIIKGHDGTGLNEAAIDAIMKAKFTPAMQRDRKVSVWMSIPIVLK